MKDYFKKILTLTGDMRGQLPLMAFLYLLALALELAGLSLIFPYISLLQDPERLNEYALWQEISSAAGISGLRETFIALSVALLAVFALKTLLHIMVQVKITRFSYDLQVYLRTRFSERFLAASYLYHTKRRSHEIINMMQSHISQFSKATAGSMLRLVGEGVTVTVIFMFLIVVSPLPTLTAIFVLLLFGLAYDRTVRRKLKQSGQDLIEANNDQLRAIKQGITSLKEARVLGIGGGFHTRIAESAGRAARINAFVAILQLLPRFLLELLIVGIVVLAVLLMISGGQSGADVIDSMAVFAVAAVRLLPSANQIVNNISNLRFSRPAVDELYGDWTALNLMTDKALALPEKAELPDEPYQSLALNGVAFRYPDTEEPVFANLSFTMKRGEIIGIAGPSGAGKSTLVNILLGLLTPQVGTMSFNGKSMNFENWAGHQLAAYIPQSPALLDDSIAANVALGTANPDQERIKSALRKAYLWDFVHSLPQKENTPVGEDAALLSGGQKQRLALARCFYFRREIIVFDEATSALDPQTERDVLGAIENLREDATVLLISHSAQPLEICDRVCYLSQGHLEEKEKENHG